MKTIELTTIKSWFAERQLLIEHNHFMPSAGQYSKQIKIPIDSGKKVCISQALCSFFNNEEEGLLWINEYGIWPSSENWDLFDGYRKSIDVTEPLWIKPGHIFSPRDIVIVKSLLSMVLFFYWGAILVPSSKKFVMEISHDEVIRMFSNQQDIIDEIAKSIEAIL
jgi:hypothetical protein